MTTSTVVLCPPLPGSPAAFDAAELADALMDSGALDGVRVMSPDIPDAGADDDTRTLQAHWVAHLAVGMSVGSALAPVLLVLGGSAGALAPALGFSQKASRRAVSGYVLVDAAVPPAESRGGDWPDAPVHYLASPTADPLEVNLARLRGWDVTEVGGTEPVTLATVIARVAVA